MMKQAFIVATILTIVLATATVTFAQATREVTVTPRSVVPIDARLRFTTMLILPEGEEILEMICGDKDFWMVSGAQNFAYIKPAKAGASTNLNIVTTTGAVYSFVLTEGAASPDLKVFILSDTASPSPPKPRLYSASDVDRIRREAETARNAMEQARAEADEVKAAATRAAEERATKFKAAYPTSLQFPYQFAGRRVPPQVAAMFHDGQTTFIRMRDGAELLAVYELADGAANLVNVRAERDTLIVPKVLSSGYLAIGKQRWVFHQRSAAAGERP